MADHEHPDSNDTDPNDAYPECEALETSERRLRRVAIEYAALGIVIVTLTIVFLAPDRAVGPAGANPAEAEYGDIYAALPTYPRPFTPEELRDARAQVAQAEAHLNTVRASTDAALARLKALERGGGG